MRLDRLCYKGSPFHRVVRGAWVQGGDISSGAGDGGCSIYGEVFGDESFAVKLHEAGILAMANDGPHTNGSQFLVTLVPQPWLNHKVVGFGRWVGPFRFLYGVKRTSSHDEIIGSTETSFAWNISTFVFTTQ